MKKLMTKLLLSCDHASKIINERDFRPLTFKENIQLKLHLFVCETCRIYDNQSKIITAFIKKSGQTKSENKNLDSKKLEVSIKNAISKK